jgi:uncharacterized membrane protein YiaA
MKLDNDRLKRIVAILYILSGFLFLFGLFLYFTNNEIVNTSASSFKYPLRSPEKINGKGLIIVSLLIAIVSAIINYKRVKNNEDNNF